MKHPSAPVWRLVRERAMHTTHQTAEGHYPGRCTVRGLGGDEAMTVVAANWRAFHARDIRIFASNEAAASGAAGRRYGVHLIAHMPVLEVARIWRFGAGSVTADGESRADCSLDRAQETLRRVWGLARFEILYVDAAGCRIAFVDPVRSPHLGQIDEVIRAFAPQSFAAMAEGGTGSALAAYVLQASALHPLADVP